jgi:nucleotide-binding universal stress UspA family protein
MYSPVPLPRKIIVAVDGSELAFKAVGYAAQLSRLTKSELVSLHVILLPSYATPKTLEILRKDLSSKADDILSKVNAAAEARGVRIVRKVVETNRSVVMAIVEFAEQKKADLIILGTRGTSGVPKLMLGSVAAGVVSFAHCPVLAVR